MTSTWPFAQVLFYTVGIRKALYNPSMCPPESFVKAGKAALDLLPYEGTVDALLQLLKKEELNPNCDVSVFRVCRPSLLLTPSSPSKNATIGPDLGYRALFGRVQTVQEKMETVIDQYIVRTEDTGLADSYEAVRVRRKLGNGIHFSLPSPPIRFIAS